MLQTILEPIVFRVEANQHARRLAMSSDHNLLGGRQSEIVREIVLHGRQRYFTALLARAC